MSLRTGQVFGRRANHVGSTGNTKALSWGLGDCLEGWKWSPWEARTNTCPEVPGATGERFVVDHSTELVLKDAAVFFRRLGCVTLVHLSSPQPQLSTLGRLWEKESLLRVLP